MLGLQDQRLEHRDGIEGRPATLGVAVAQALHEPAAEILEVDRRLENLQGSPILLIRSRCSDNPKSDR